MGEAFRKNVHYSDDGVELVEAADYAAMKTLLAYGTMADQAASAVAITGGTISQITGPIAVSPDSNLLSDDASVWVGRQVDDSGTGNAHCFSDSSIISRGGTIGYNSFDARIQVTGTNDYDHLALFQSGISYESTGAMGNLYGFANLPTVEADTGVITNIIGVYDRPVVNSTNSTNRYGLFVADITGTGTITNNYGVYIAALANGSTSNFAIYSAGGYNYFAGNVAIGTSVKSTVKLIVKAGTNQNLWVRSNSSTLELAAATDASAFAPMRLAGSTILLAGVTSLGGDLNANGNTIHFGTAENVQTPTGTTATIDLGAENHHTLDCGSATDAITLTLTVPPGPCGGTIIVIQDDAAKGITWSPSSGSAVWLGTEPTWASDTSKTRIVSWRWNATNLYLSATDTN